jgi:hypothetical protein
MTTKETDKDALVYNFPHETDTVLKEITSEEYVNDRAKWNIIDEVTADIKLDANGGVVMDLDRYIVRDYPKALKHLLPAKTHMIHIEKWERDGTGWKGTYDVNVLGSPVTVGAEFTLKKQGVGCQLRIIHSATAKIPLLGRRVEKYILGQTRSQFRDQLSYLDMRLGGVSDLLPRDTSKYPLPE